MNNKNYNNQYGSYDTGYNAYESSKNDETQQTQDIQQIEINEIEEIDNPNDEKHVSNQSMNYGFIGSTKKNKYSNPYDNNVYGDLSSTTKKEKRMSKKVNKKRNSSEALNQSVDVTQAAVPVVYYAAPQTVNTVPTVYYTTPVAAPVGTPVAIQYVNTPNLEYEDGSESSSHKDSNKEKRESRRYISYFGDKENVEDEVVKTEDKEKEYQEIMNELGIKRKDGNPKDLKSRLIRNQLVIAISLLLLFFIFIVAYFVWPRVPDITITDFTLQDSDPIQYKLPINIENLEKYVDLTNVTSSDVDSFVQFKLVTHFDVKNNNYLPYKFNSLVLDVS